MPNISVEELNKVLQKSGLPTGNALSMQQSTPFAGDAIAGAAYGADTQIPEYQKAYHSQLDEIAAMDKKLQGVYGNPSSGMYIEHAGARDAAIDPATNLGYKEVGRTADKIQNRQKELDTTIDEALSYYKQLTTLQDREEKRAAKQAKAGKGKGKTGDKQTDSILNAVELQKKRVGLAGIADKNAGDYFLTTPKAFQDQWIRDFVTAAQEAETQGLPVTAMNPTKQQVEESLKAWTKEFKPSKEEGGSDIDTLRASLLEGD